MKFSLTLIAATAAIALSGCATIVSGTTQELKINSNPAGAVVYIGTMVTSNGQSTMVNRVAVGQTPMTVKIYRKDGGIMLEKPGYQPTQLPLTTRMNKWVWGDIAAGSLMSTSIDTWTGASREFDPGEFMVDMKPIRQ